MNPDEYETLPTNNIAAHMTAGAIAGILEHCVMYPLDSVKTRMQSILKPDIIANRGISETLTRMVQTEGIFRPVRGMSAVVVGSGPAHALYFSCYEYLKETMTQRIHNPRYNTLCYGAAGCISTLLHDAVMNPSEVVKQRVQMANSQYKSVLACVAGVYKTEGLPAFYRSYTTQLTMNIPFQSIHFMMYEFMQTLLNEEKTYNPTAHMISGGIAGGVAAAATTPLDVCKTVLNTQQTQTRVTGLTDAVQTVYRDIGLHGFFRGMQARVLYTMPAAAICWSTYEFFKYLLCVTKEDEVTYQISDHLDLNWKSTSGFEQAQLGQNSEKLSLKIHELPAISGAGLYGTVSFNTVHAEESPSVSGMHKGNSLYDVKHT